MDACSSIVILHSMNVFDLVDPHFITKIVNRDTVSLLAAQIFVLTLLTFASY